jgi:Ca2+-binding RTX toxin-like protein
MLGRIKLGAALALVPAIAAMPSGPAIASRPAVAHDCLGFVPTIVGTSEDDDLEGTERRDVIWTGAGNDEVAARDGNDVVCLGRGHDRADGEDGVDVIEGDFGFDKLDGGRGDDDLLGGPGPDQLRDSGAHDSDTMAGGRGGDFVKGGEFLFGGGGNDTLLGEDGSDSIWPGEGHDYVDGGAGPGDVVSYEFSDTAIEVDLSLTTAFGSHVYGANTDLNDVEGVTGTELPDRILGDERDNEIRGLAGSDNLQGGAGNNVIEGGGGDDQMYGGAGSDLLSFTSSSNGVEADLSAGTADGDGQDLVSGFESIRGSSFDDRLTGDAEPNSLYGRHGANHLEGRAGDDTLVDGDGDAGEGEDTCYGGRIDNCEHLVVVETGPGAYVDSPRVGAVLHPDDLHRITGGKTAGFGPPPPDDVYVSLRRLTPDGCSWWSARRDGLVEGGCGHPRWNRARPTDTGWTLPLRATLPTGTYQTCATPGYKRLSCYETFRPNLVDFRLSD